MAKAKYTIFLAEIAGTPVNAVVEIRLSIPAPTHTLLDAIGVGDEERHNLTSQRLAEIAQLIGAADD